MDPVKNPFTPSAGTPPPFLAGRDTVIEDARVALARVKSGLHARSQMLLGLRGVGKTVLLGRINELASKAGFRVIELESPEDRKLAEMLVPKLRSVLIQLSRHESVMLAARRALGVLRSFASAFKVSLGEVEFGVEKELGIADSGNLEFDLPDLLVTVAQTAKDAETGIALLLDEVQYLSERDLGALIVSQHKLGQKGLPLILFGAGLPQLAALAGDAKSYAERLFNYQAIGPLSEEAVRTAIREPVIRAGAQVTDEALDLIFQATKGYPYFVQEWGRHAWDVANAPTITAADVRTATTRAVRALDSEFFNVRFERLTPKEKDYCRGMAELGPGAHRSGEIAKMVGKTVQGAGPLSDTLIKKGMIYRPQHGDQAFTVPMFDEFMKRAMPDWKPSTRKPASGPKS